MSRSLARRCPLASIAVVCALALILPAGAAASSGPVFNGSATGTVLALSGNSLTIQTAGPRIGVINAMTAAADRITSHDYPYVYGGGHLQAGIASVGLAGRRHRRHLGFDCSGSVTAVLASGGLWPAGGGVPSDAGVIATLRSQGLIARGVGAGPVEVTLYDDPGFHIFMNIDGRFFGTSDGAGAGSPRGGAGWLDDGAPDAYSRAYKPYHFRRSVLRGSTSSGHIVSFQIAALQSAVGSVQVGDTVQVAYQETSSGALDATSLVFPGAINTTGTVTAVASDGSWFAIQTSSGSSLTFSTVNDPSLVQGMNVGDSVQVTYTTSAATSTARAVTDSGPAAPAPPSPPPATGN